MNINLWNVLMKSDFVFNRESYLTLRQSCLHFLQQHVPQLLQLDEKEVSDFLSYAGIAVNECYKSGCRFDREYYLCQLESVCSNDAEWRRKVYLHCANETFEQRMVMLFVAIMGIYASKCDDDDDFWEPYGLSGSYLSMDEDLLATLVTARKECRQAELRSVGILKLIHTDVAEFSLILVADLLITLEKAYRLHDDIVEVHGVRIL